MYQLTRFNDPNELMDTSYSEELITYKEWLKFEQVRLLTKGLCRKSIIKPNYEARDPEKKKEIALFVYGGVPDKCKSCYNKVHAKGMCKKHYHLQYRHTKWKEAANAQE